MPGFLDLPTELRLNIYELLIPMDMKIRLILLEPEHMSPVRQEAFGIRNAAALPAQIRRYHYYATSNHVSRVEAMKIVKFCKICRLVRNETQRRLYSTIALFTYFSRQTLRSFSNVGFSMQLQHLVLPYRYFPPRSDEVLQRHPQLRALTLLFPSTAILDPMDATGQMFRDRRLKRRIMNVVSSRHSKLRKGALLQETWTFLQHHHTHALVFSDESSRRLEIAINETRVWLEIDLNIFRAATEKSRSRCPVTPLEALAGWEGEQDLAMFNEPSYKPKSLSGRAEILRDGTSDYGVLLVLGAQEFILPLVVARNRKRQALGRI